MKKYHLVQLVENSSPSTLKFKTLKAMNAFINAFEKKYGTKNYSDGYWIDFSVTNITGIISIYDESTEIEVM